MKNISKKMFQSFVLILLFSSAFLSDVQAKKATKEQMAKIIQEQPDDSSYDEVLRELAFARMIERGLKDSEANRTISNEQMKHRIKAWRK